jgi:hypothetical protein
MTSTRRRGRPFKDGLPDVPEHLKGRSNGENPFASALPMYEEYLKNVRANEPITRSNQLLTDRSEWSECKADKQRKIDQEYNEEVAKSKDWVSKGGRKTSENAYDRAYAICNKNKDLLREIKPNGSHTINKVAAIIRTEWNERAPTYDDFPKSSTELADLPAPSVRTLRTYIKKFLKLAKAASKINRPC